MTTPIWGKPKAKKGKDLFWGLPDGPKSRYPYNEYKVTNEEEYEQAKRDRKKVKKLQEAVEWEKTKRYLLG